MSYIHPESIEILQVFARARHVHSSFGGSLFGPDLSAWPEAAIEAAAAIESERIALENARHEAERRE